MTSANVRGRYLRYRASATTPPQRPRHCPSGVRQEPKEGPPVHPSEPAYPCCLPALGRFTRYTPHEGLPKSLPVPTIRQAPTHTYIPAPTSVSLPTEDSPRGLGR